MTRSTGKLLEDRGWLQCALIDKDQALPLLSKGILIDLSAETTAQSDFVLILATQSCNLAHSDVNTVQLGMGYHIGEKDKARQNNKHPRELDTFYLLKKEEGPVEQNIRININEKIFIPKDLLLNVNLREEMYIPDYEKKSYVNWLGSHFTKPALPTHFNDLIAAEKRKGGKKARKKEKALADFLGVYIQLYPNRDLGDNEKYQANLLLLVKPEADLDKAAQLLESYAEVLINAGIDVKQEAQYSTKISVAVLQNFQRIYLDELSYSEKGDLPPDVKTSIF